MEAVEQEHQDTEIQSDQSVLTRNQLRLFKILLDSDWEPKESSIEKFKLYSKEGVEIQQQDLLFIRPQDVLYIDLDNNQFNYGQILDQFEILEKIGQGGFGSVYKIKEKHTLKIYAMKTIKAESYLNKANKIEELFREQKILKQLDHRNIIRLHHAFQVKGKICLIMDYACGGEFEYYLVHQPN